MAENPPLVGLNVPGSHRDIKSPAPVGPTALRDWADWCGSREWSPGRGRVQEQLHGAGSPAQTALNPVTLKVTARPSKCPV